MFKEFKKFALKGNVIDMAVGVIIGGAFGKIVSSVVADLIMPLLGLIMGKMNFANMFILLGKEPVVDGNTVNITTTELAKQYNIPTFNYGQFITNVIDFIIIAFSIFIFIKIISNLGKINLGKKKKKAEPPPTTKKCEFCISEIDIEATRCPFCTSLLPDSKEKTPENEEAKA